MKRATKKVLITDIDNTLFDCVDLWVRCFGAMLDKIMLTNKKFVSVNCK
jgi:hypothetical protein